MTYLRFKNSLVQKVLAIGLVFCFSLTPFLALAQQNPILDIGTGIAGNCGGGLLSMAVGYATGLILGGIHEGAADSASAADTILGVPISRPAVTPVEEGLSTEGAGEDVAAGFGDFWENLEKKFKEYCLDPIAKEIAIALIRQMRNMVIEYINTGNFGGTPTFVTNFEFDYKKTASNAARLFASNLTGIDYCNYFPQNPSTNLNFEVNLRLELQCSYQKPRAQYMAQLQSPWQRTALEDILLRFPENDPLKVALAQQEKLSAVVADTKLARQTQVIGGKGFIGTETCVKQKVIQPARYYDPGTGETCEVNDLGFPAPGCLLQEAITVCEESKVKTPGSFAADIATEPLKSEFREGEIVDEFGEAIAQIVNTLVSKVITSTLSGAGL